MSFATEYKRQEMTDCCQCLSLQQLELRGLLSVLTFLKHFTLHLKHCEFRIFVNMYLTTLSELLQRLGRLVDKVLELSYLLCGNVTYVRPVHGESSTTADEDDNMTYYHYETEDMKINLSANGLSQVRFTKYSVLKLACNKFRALSF